MATWLHRQRLDAVHDAVQRSGASTVLDLGCGDGDLFVELATDPQITRLLGVDICAASLDRLRQRLAEMQRIAERNGQDGYGAVVDLVCASIADPDRRLAGFDCAILVETIEHVPPGRLSGLERAVFTGIGAPTVVVTTPNAEFNPLLGVPSHRFRHPDHKFEWPRSRFRAWAERVAAGRGYSVACHDIAGQHPDHGGASQMAVFSRQHA